MDTNVGPMPVKYTLDFHIVNLYCVSYANLAFLKTAVERFHISAFLLFVLAQNILEAEGHWFKNFLYLTIHILVTEQVPNGILE